MNSSPLSRISGILGTLRLVRSNEPHVGFSTTLAIYIARHFMLSTMAMICALTGLVSLFDFIDLLRRTATRPNVPTTLVLEIAALHIPYYVMYVLPFGMLLGGIVCFSRLTRSSELIVARAAGISAWQFLASPLACALFTGLLTTTGISALSSAMYRQAEILDQTYLRTGGGPMTMSGGALWLRQSDESLAPHGVAIIHARDMHMANNTINVSDVTIFRLDDHDHLLMRVETPQGFLAKKEWHFQDAMNLKPDHFPVKIGQLILPSDLTVERIQESFASPDTLSVWTLPGFIALLQRSGFPSIRHRLHFQSLLALPILAGTMALVSAGFSMRPARRGGVARMLGSGIAAGFALFTVSKVAEQFGRSGALPPVLAAWAPTGAGLCLAVALLLHMEDG
ncbi:LPS export ABC transporter permease LptG [Gluconobacter wancherniae]|nr:LPS export ABC transporter permease LptG [Gluconobacter wancherniae]MBF0853882.1 LPS export ABC transporter permease LptG [Gluconobacter wancherniae]MBS1062268.1 LPS export ABC transporter permease LptG [Gluconobacter wancherniae]MBS1089142.1 LPS export ABC transporter permease LptG [Gluconobacter wancherniae]GBD56937.1 LPS export ABC transporter permease LptG [Gluconobacter wancherniae NBRC 103581]GBR64857.1 transporter YjgP/YjgQ [Gluconobacter wancherniae NBRC 103581]